MKTPLSTKVVTEIWDTNREKRKSENMNERKINHKRRGGEKIGDMNEQRREKNIVTTLVENLSRK